MKVYFTKHFKRQLKRLKKKYQHVSDDLLDNLDHFNLASAISIGKSIYKLRVKSRDIGKGKSGGFRVYIYLYVRADSLVPLCMYAKSQTESLTENEVQYHMDQTTQELFIALL